MTVEALTLIAVAVVGWLALSATAARRNVSAAMALVAVGLLAANGPTAVLELQLRSESIKHLAEATLALVLFADASRVNVARLRAAAGVPARLLALGLPLTVVTGALAASALLPDVSIWVAAAVAAIVAPTDAALGAPILADRRVPESVRRTLNVESGLNDGIATPFVNLFLAAAAAGSLGAGHGLGSAVSHLVVGAALGVGVGLGGGLLARTAHRVGTMAAGSRPLAVLALAGASYTLALVLHGNGFVAAFVAGMAFGTTLDQDEEAVGRLTEEVGEGLTLVVWFIFGAVLLVPAVRVATWGDLAFAVAALTVVRMVPVALALLGSGLDRATVGFIGWFGPRGLASVVFTLIAVDELPEAMGDRVLAAATLTVVLSVVAHGVTAAPFARRYAAGRAAAGDGSGELRTRRSVTRHLPEGDASLGPA